MRLPPVVEAPRERPEAFLRHVVFSYRGVQVIRIVLRPWLVGFLGADTRSCCEDGIKHERGEALVDDQHLGGAPGDEVACRVLGGVEDYVRYGLRLVDRRDAHQPDTKLGAPFVEEGGVYGPGHQLRHAYGLSLLLAFN
jgi:hypothetical protein